MKIYAITNKIDGHQYIGSETIPGSRKKTHLWRLRRGTHHSKYLQRAFDKHGEAAFVFSTLEDGLADNSELLRREQHYIDTLKPVYNMCCIAGNTSGIKHTEAQKQKISAWLQAAYADGRWVPSRHMLGKTHSVETRLKMSQASRGVPKSAEARANMSASRIARGTSPAQCEANRVRGLGRHPTEETRAKLRAAQQRRTEHQSPTASTRAKMSEAHRKRWAAMDPVERAERGRKLAAMAKGRIVSAATRDALRKAKLGAKASAETRERLSAAQRARWAAIPKSERSPSQEVRERFSAGQRARWARVRAGTA